MRRHHYSILSYTEAIGDSRAQPFAVIVESSRFVYCLGFRLEGDETSVSGQMLLQFPDILKERVEHASREARKTGGRALDFLVKDFQWNIAASAPTSKLSFRSIENVAKKIFSDRIERWTDEVPKSMTTELIPRVSFNFRSPLAA